LSNINQFANFFTSPIGRTLADGSLFDVNMTETYTGLLYWANFWLGTSGVDKGSSGAQSPPPILQTTKHKDAFILH